VNFLNEISAKLSYNAAVSTIKRILDMKTIPITRKPNYAKRIAIFLITVFLVSEMVGCFTPFRMQYQLTISSTEGGQVRTPGEGIFTYSEGTVVNLTAEADDAYQFVNWTGNVSNIADVHNSTTTITMNCDYSITANFGWSNITQIAAGPPLPRRNSSIFYFMNYWIIRRQTSPMLAR
jgi:hypothetical protein